MLRLVAPMLELVKIFIRREWHRGNIMDWFLTIQLYFNWQHINSVFPKSGLFFLWWKLVSDHPVFIFTNNILYFSPCSVDEEKWEISWVEAKVNNCKALISLVRYLFKMSVVFLSFPTESTLPLGRFNSCGVERVNDCYRSPFFV